MAKFNKNEKFIYYEDENTASPAGQISKEAKERIEKFRRSKFRQLGHLALKS